MPPPSPALHSRRSLPRCNSFASQVFGVFASVPPPDLCRRQIFATAFFLSPPVAFPAWSWLHLLKASYMLFRLLDQRISHRPEQCSRGTPRGSVAQARRWHPSLAGTGATPPSRPPPSSTSAAALPDRLRASWEGPFLTCCSPFLARNFVSWHLRWWGLLHPLSEAHELNGETRFCIRRKSTCSVLREPMFCTRGTVSLWDLIFAAVRLFLGRISSCLVRSLRARRG